MKRSGFQVKLTFFTWKSDLSACFVVIVKGWVQGKLSMSE